MVDLAIPEFGYQNHVSADRRHRLIRSWLVTDAAAHGGARLADLPGDARLTCSAALPQALAAI